MSNESPRALITGNSSGLGLGLSHALLDRGYQVHGCSRRGCAALADRVVDVHCDLSDFDTIGPALDQLLAGVERLDLVALNAGILGEIEDMSRMSVARLAEIMDINVWSNKVILDWLLDSGIAIDQIVAISSGAAVLGNRGWGGYALSKATLNMLCRLYAHEFPDTHVAAIAPGLIDTRIIDTLCDLKDTERFPALARIHAARGTEALLSPAAAAERLLEALPALKDFESGSFVDVRQILAPEEYEELMAARNRPGR
ncbi:SDR family NAD(P)-dependent oxidoreductase [Guyparkeria hydrothermalis]|uniref:SDR family NAD(P)-dependent oxidoreductase n=1 Tax=Guyparkeria hydrothermalis TaxID=923 RepID=UPI002020E596|nr:SDR family NAD(P)-dependent oxidoreductase [Guyparkeria hydrothermalis]MCL7744660.1 SDR family NAD(P)-dependent oxidoreductase [Guyparkeria hydrothermalis]